jgi:hypothetical protein
MEIVLGVDNLARGIGRRNIWLSFSQELHLRRLGFFRRGRGPQHARQTQAQTNAEMKWQRAVTTL